MATTYTTNYNLGKQENHADKFDMDVITDNADKIDAALTAKADKSTTYTKTEVDTALSGKQATLTTEQLAAVNSGITSTDVTQIETNKNNISYNTNQGVKNLLSFDADMIKSINTGGTWNGNTWSLGNNVTLTINSDKSITLNGNANAGKTVYLTKNLGMAENTYTLSTGALTAKLWSRITEVGGTENNYTGSTTHIDKTCQPNHITLYVENGCTLSNLTIYPMLTLKSLYDADPTYQPYALSNVELTYNISLLTPRIVSTDITELAAESYADGTVCGYADSFAGLSAAWVVIRTYTLNREGSRKMQIVEVHTGNRKTRFFNGAWGAWS